MTTDINFRSYALQDRDDCLGLFDNNCPEFFAVNEREDYTGFLNSLPSGYEVCILNDVIVGAYGLVGENITVFC